MGLAVVVTVVTGADYAVRAVRLRRRSWPRRPGAPGGQPVSAGLRLTPRRSSIGLLAARQQSIAVAESLTGGLLAAALTDIPGASAVFRGGIVAYATELKAVLLGVDRGLLDAHGAVSAEVAAAMAEGVRGRLGAAVGRRHHRGGRARPGRGQARRAPCTSRSAPGARPGSSRWPWPAAGTRSARRPSREALATGPCHRAGREPDDYSVTLAANTAAGALPTVGEGEVPWSYRRPTSRRECRDGPASSLAW